MKTQATLMAVLSLSLSASAHGQGWAAVDSAMGRAGIAQSDGVQRYNFPRGDLQVTAAGVRLKPSFALGGWVAIRRVPGAIHGDVAMAMGDLVLTEREVTPVVTVLEQGGVDVTAIHHHLIRESPRVLYVHVHAIDDPVKIARTIHAALALTRTPPPVAAAPPAAAVTLPLDTAAIASALGRSGRVNGGVYQVSVPRADTITEDGFAIPPVMGLSTAINFQPTGDGKAAITGDFVMLADEVNPVIRALRDHGIEVVSLHSHLLKEQPRLFFMHFWGNANAVTLARGLRAALDRTHSRP